MGQTIRVSTKPVIVVQDFHRALYALADKAETAHQTVMGKMCNIVETRYGDTPPTFEQYTADQQALKKLAADKGYADNQWVRKPYAAAVKLLYGALPESNSPAAVAKRMQREADAAKNPPKVGAPAGQTQPRKAGPGETIEQFVARVGIFATLDAVARILASDDSTAAASKQLVAVEAVIRADLSKKAA